MAILYGISFKILELNFWVYLFLVSVSITLLFSVKYIFKALFDYEQTDFGTIKDTDEEYTNALNEGIPIEEVYLTNLDQINIWRKDINDMRIKNIYLAYRSFVVSIILPVIIILMYVIWKLVGGYIIQILEV